MTGNICCNCFSSIFINNQLPCYIRAVDKSGKCEVCDSEFGMFYARRDEIEKVKEMKQEK